MLMHPTLDQLRALKLDGMADAFVELQAQGQAADLAHAEWLALLLDREAAYRGNRPEPDIAGKTVIVVDDGLATGATMRAAAAALRSHEPAAIVAAVPVAAARTCAGLRDVVNRVVCLATPEPFHAVGLYYANFEQIGDDEVRRLIAA